MSLTKGFKPFVPKAYQSITMDTNQNLDAVLLHQFKQVNERLTLVVESTATLLHPLINGKSLFSAELLSCLDLSGKIRLLRCS